MREREKVRDRESERERKREREKVRDRERERETLLPSLGPSGASRHLATLLRICMCVCSLHKCMSFKQQFEWGLHVTSRPKLLVEQIRCR